MAEMADAPEPTIGTEQEPKVAAVGATSDIDDALEKLGITDGKQLENIATASQQSGKLAQMVGDLRSELSQTQDALRNVQQSQTPEQTMFDDLEDRPITMRELKGFYREVTDNNVRAQKQAWGEMSSIQNDPHYSAFQQTFEDELRKPEAQAALNGGQTNMTAIYNAVVVNGLKGLLVGMRNEMDGLKGTSKREVPHIESQTSTGPMAQIDKSDRQEQIEKIQENRQGNDDDIDQLLDVLLPRGEITKMRMT